MDNKIQKKPSGFPPNVVKFLPSQFTPRTPQFTPRTRGVLGVNWGYLGVRRVASHHFFNFFFIK
jgi:hypothetical protein